MNTANNNLELSFILDSVLQSHKTYKEQLTIVAQKFSEEAVHDFRVAIRRFLSVVYLIDLTYSQGYTRSLKKELKRQLDIFSKLRDIQVQILAVNSMFFTHPSLYFFYKDMVSKEKKLITATRKKVAELANVSMEADIFFLKQFLKNSSYCPHRNKEDFVNIGYMAWQKVIELKKIATKDDLRSIHQVRLAVKKFRYTLEALNPIIGVKKGLIKSMNTFQTRLGEIQDSVVLTDKLVDFLENNPKVKPGEFLIVIEEERLRQNVRITQFFDNFNIFYTFWRKDFFD